MKNKKQGMYELLRIVFKKNDAYIETRKETKDYTETEVFSKKSIIKKAGEKTLETEKSEELLKLPEKLKNTGIEFANLYIELYHHIKLIPFSYCYFKSKRKQHIHNNTPKEIISHLEKNNEIGCEKIPGYLVLTSSGDFNELQRVYIGKDRLWYFKRNAFTKKWSSSNKKYCMILRNAPHQKFNIDGRNITKLLKGTLYEGLKYNSVFNRFGFVWTLDKQKQYLSVEQAVKIKRYDIACALLKQINLNQQRKHLSDCIHPIDKKESLPQVLGITGKQIKFIRKDLNEYYLYENIFRIKEIINDKYITRFIADPETLIKCIIFEKSELISVLKIYEKDNKDPAPFIRALLKQELYTARRNITEWLDYVRRMLPVIQNNAHRYQTTYNFPVCIKPSKIKETHDYANQLYRQIMDEILSKRKEEQRIIEDSNIKKQKEKDKKLEYFSDKFSLLLPESGDEIRNEGIFLHHCVGSYVSSVACGKTHILFLRKNDDIKKPFMTMEVNKGKIRQLFGCRDSFNKDISVRSFVKNYAKEKNLTINCKI